MRQRGPRIPDTHRQRQAGWTRKPRRTPRGGVARSSDAGAVILYGWHTVKAALENPRDASGAFYATENAARRLAEDGVALPLEPEVVRPDAIAQRLGAGRRA